jgi:hypothetical protein
MVRIVKRDSWQDLYLNKNCDSLCYPKSSIGTEMAFTLLMRILDNPCCVKGISVGPTLKININPVVYVSGKRILKIKPPVSQNCAQWIITPILYIHMLAGCLLRHQSIPMNISPRNGPVLSLIYLLYISGKGTLHALTARINLHAGLVTIKIKPRIHCS